MSRSNEIWRPVALHVLPRSVLLSSPPTPAPRYTVDGFDASIAKTNALLTKPFVKFVPEPA